MKPLSTNTEQPNSD